MSHTSDLNYSSQFDSSPGPCTFDNSDSPEISFKLPRLAIANFCSVRNKQSELELFLDNQDIHLLIGTESHLNDTIFDSEVFPRNYSVFRKDSGDSRPDLQGGQVGNSITIVAWL